MCHLCLTLSVMFVDYRFSHAPVLAEDLVSVPLVITVPCTQRLKSNMPLCVPLLPLPVMFTKRPLPFSDVSLPTAQVNPDHIFVSFPSLYTPFSILVHPFLFGPPLSTVHSPLPFALSPLSTVHSPLPFALSGQPRARVCSGRRAVRLRAPGPAPPAQHAGWVWIWILPGQSRPRVVGWLRIWAAQWNCRGGSWTAAYRGGAGGCRPNLWDRFRRRDAWPGSCVESPSGFRLPCTQWDPHPGNCFLCNRPHADDR